MTVISIKSDVDKTIKKLSALAREQIPYAEVLAVNALAVDVQQAERKAMPHIFDRPTPFTINSVRVQFARKGYPVARVFVMDIAAEYLYPYEVGGYTKLLSPNNVTWLEPIDFSLLNQYGNFPVDTIERLIGTSRYVASGRGVSRRLMKGMKPLPGKKNYFVGKIKVKGGTVSGVWKRIGATKKRGKGLKLVIKFGEPKLANHNLGFGYRGAKVIAQNKDKRFGSALARAIATAK